MAKKKSSSEGTSTVTKSVRTRLLIADEKMLSEIAKREPSNLSNLIARIVREWLAARQEKHK